MLQNTRSNPCLWGQEAPCPVEELGINTVMETQGWARGADGRGVCFDADVQTLQRNLSVSRELPLTWLLSQHQFPSGGQSTKHNISLGLGSVAARVFYCECQFCCVEGFLFLKFK